MSSGSNCKVLLLLMMCVAGRAMAADRAAERPGTSLVRLARVPGGGLQPQVMVGRDGVVHMVYLKGDPKAPDVFYVRSKDGGSIFSTPIRVNSQPGSAIAMGTIRGAQIALGKGDRVHVAWNGSGNAQPKGPPNPAMPADDPNNGTPMLYSRLNDAGTAFEPQRNLMRITHSLDGGGALAADEAGNVYVAWHGSDASAKDGEGSRRVWISVSRDEGLTFAQEIPANRDATGACACCQMRLFASSRGTLYALYRTATETVHRDIHLLVSQDHGKTFTNSAADAWEIGACPMSSMDLVEARDGILAAWETKEQVYFAKITPETSTVSTPLAAPGAAPKRKYPFVATDAERNTILVWTQGAGWAKGGSLAWQVYGKDGKPVAEKGLLPGVPAWSFATAFQRRDGGFTIVY